MPVSTPSDQPLTPHSYGLKSGPPSLGRTVVILVLYTQRVSGCSEPWI